MLTVTSNPPDILYVADNSAQSFSSTDGGDVIIGDAGGNVTISILDGSADEIGSVTIEGDFDTSIDSIDDLIGVIDVDDGTTP